MFEVPQNVTDPVPGNPDRGDIVGRILNGEDGFAEGGLQIVDGRWFDHTRIFATEAQRHREEPCSGLSFSELRTYFVGMISFLDFLLTMNCAVTTPIPLAKKPYMVPNVNAIGHIEAPPP